MQKLGRLPFANLQPEAGGQHGLQPEAHNTHHDKHMVHRLYNTKMGLTMGFMCASQWAASRAPPAAVATHAKHKRRQPVHLIGVHDLVGLYLGFGTHAPAGRRAACALPAAIAACAETSAGSLCN